jgi:hypothetical protein
VGCGRESTLYLLSIYYLLSSISIFSNLGIFVGFGQCFLHWFFIKKSLAKANNNTEIATYTEYAVYFILFFLRAYLVFFQQFGYFCFTNDFFIWK